MARLADVSVDSGGDGVCADGGDGIQPNCGSEVRCGKSADERAALASGADVGGGSVGGSDWGGGRTDCGHVVHQSTLFLLVAGGVGGGVLLLIGFLLGYLIFPKTIIKTVIQEVDVDSTSIVQEARLGYVPQDELSEAIRELHSEKSLRFLKTDYRYEIRDSIVIRDSVKIMMVPFFIADTNFTFAKKTDKWEFDTNIGIETKFYPDVMAFETNAKMNALNITVTYKKPWEFDLFSGVAGFGVGTALTIGIGYLTR